MQPCRYCLYSVAKIGFSPRNGRHVAPINVKFDRNVAIQLQKLSKFRILAINFPFRGDSFALFLRNSQRLYASFVRVAFKFLVWSLSGDEQKSYEHFPAVGAFSHKFSTALAAKLWIRSKKLEGGCINGTDLLYHNAKYGGDRAPVVDEKVWCFVFLISHAFE